MYSLCVRMTSDAGDVEFVNLEWTISKKVKNADGTLGCQFDKKDRGKVLAYWKDPVGYESGIGAEVTRFINEKKLDPNILALKPQVFGQAEQDSNIQCFGNGKYFRYGETSAGLTCRGYRGWICEGNNCAKGPDAPDGCAVKANCNPNRLNHLLKQ